MKKQKNNPKFKNNIPKGNVLAPGLKHYPLNGAVVYKGAILVRMVYLEDEQLTEKLLDTIKEYCRNK